jgi:hypothetical protein
MNHKRGDFMVFPSQPTLCEEMGYSPRSEESIKRFSDELQRVGLLRVVRTKDKNRKRWNSKKYYFKVLEQLKFNGTSGNVVDKFKGTSNNVVSGTSDNVENVNELNEEEEKEITTVSSSEMLTPSSSTVENKDSNLKVNDNFSFIENAILRNRLTILNDFIPTLSKKDSKRLVKEFGSILEDIKANPFNPYINSRLLMLEVDSGLRVM